MTQSEMEKLQKELNGLALGIGRKFSMELDYSIDSLRDVDKILLEVHKDFEKTKDEHGIKGIALEFAAYIVNVIEKNNIVQGNWERDSKDQGKDTFPYNINDGRTIFPYSWCLKMIIDGEADNISNKFDSLLL